MGLFCLCILSLNFVIHPNGGYPHSQLEEAITRGESKTGLCLKMLLLPYHGRNCLRSNS